MLQEHVEWTGAVSNRELPAFLQRSDIFIHDGATNSLDKTLLEASLCGCIVVSSNPAYRNLTETLAPELIFAPKDHQALKALILMRDYHYRKDAVSAHIRKTFDISTLATNIITTY